MKKTLIIGLLFFSAGFLTHALVFPDVLANGIIDVKSVIIPNAPETTQTTNDPLITKITFDGKRFNRHNITIRKTNYLHITNSSKTEPMELIGTRKDLSTPRGYGESETVKAQFNELGQFAVADKNNPQERLIITVK